MELLYPDENIDFRCYIVGGGALIIMGYILRATHDIDVIYAIPNFLKELFNKYDMNCEVSAYEDNFPIGFEERANKIPLNTSKVVFYTLSLEDLVISKLCTTRGEQDIIDITSPNIIKDIDWQKLRKLGQSMEYSMISSMNYENFRYAYNDYVRRFNHEENII